MSRCHRCGWIVWHLECVNPNCRKHKETADSLHSDEPNTSSLGSGGKDV